MNSEREKSILIKLAAVAGILAVALFLSAWFTEETAVEKNNLQAITLRAESHLHKLEALALHTADTVLSMDSKVNIMFFFSKEPSSPKKITYLIYKDKQLLAWSGNDVTFVSIDSVLASSQPFLHLPNGWYRVLSKEKGDKKAVIFILVYSEYSYQNKFLVNGFNPALEIPPGMSLSEVDSKFIVHSSGGEKLFAINKVVLPEQQEKFPLPELLETWAMVILLLSLLCFGRWLLYRSFTAALVLSALILGARIAMLTLQFPEPLYQTTLFSPAYYAASFFFNSPGDLLLNILSILAIILIFFQHQTVINWYTALKSSATGAIVHSAFLSVIAVMVFTAVDYYASGLIINSKISFDLNNILELEGFSILGFLMLASMMGICFLVFRFAAEIIQRSFLAKETKTRYAVFVVVLLVLIAVKVVSPGVFPEFDMMDVPFLIALAVLSEIIFIRKIRLPVSYPVIFLVLLSFYTSMLVSEFSSRKQDENLMALARKLESRRDHVAEHLFEDINPQLKQDTILRNMLEDKRNDLALLRLQQVYFSGYWNKYNITVVATIDTLPGVTAVTAEKLIREKSDTTLTPGLFFIRDNPDNISYIARYFPSEVMGIYVLLSEKFIQTEKGFPELYLSGDAGAIRGLENFSFARYNYGSLISSYGSYPYSSGFSFGMPKNEFEFSDENSYRHLVYKSTEAKLVVVSKSAVSKLFPFTTFSFVLSFFALLLLGVYGIRQLGEGEKQHISLRQRVHISLIFIVVISFALIGWTTVSYVKGRYDKEIDDRISEKITAIHHAMEMQLPQENMLADILSDEKTLLLTRIASNLSADFNLYDLNGRLIFSSQPRLYQQGIISDRMNPDAVLEMAVKGSTRFIQPENIGGLTYIAAYEPVRNRSNATEGFIGLPYFQKQEELRRELSSFIGSLMNLYMLLLAAALGVAYFISSRITRPLLVLQEKFETTRLGKANEQIEWKRKDEIGNLVKQYNIMVDELEISAELLARSEREIAWREMAKQVAHEIKNPLTPMKLNIQLLQKAMEEKSPRLNELTEKVSHMLMEQIDALTSIASSFSSFARMPQSRREKVNLNEIISSASTLYDNSSSVKITLNGSGKEYFILADKEELSRLFGNLVKNAIQSIPEGRAGTVEIKIAEKNNFCIVSVTDNGMGIPAELQSKIFTPNFTTKSGGMGLGLAIVKSIAESIGGKAWFETKEGKGTSFFVEMPLSS